MNQQLPLAGEKYRNIAVAINPGSTPGLAQGQFAKWKAGGQCHHNRSLA